MGIHHVLALLQGISFSLSVAATPICLFIRCLTLDCTLFLRQEREPAAGAGRELRAGPGLHHRADHLCLLPRQRGRAELRLQPAGGGLHAALQARPELPGTPPFRVLRTQLRISHAKPCHTNVSSSSADCSLFALHMRRLCHTTEALCNVSCLLVGCSCGLVEWGSSQCNKHWDSFWKGLVVKHCELHLYILITGKNCPLISIRLNWEDILECEFFWGCRVELQLTFISTRQSQMACLLSQWLTCMAGSVVPVFVVDCLPLRLSCCWFIWTKDDLKRYPVLLFAPS